METSIRLFSKFAPAALLACAALASAEPLRADVIYTYSTPANATNGGESVSAKVTIDIASNLIKVQLTDTSKLINDMGQVLTGVTISLSGSPKGASVATGLVGSSADVVVVNGNGSITDYGTNPIFGKETINGLSYDGWAIGNTTSSSDLSVFGTGGPNFGVLDTTQTSYSKNGSIAGNSPHNPFSRGTANFNISYTGGVTPVSTSTLKATTVTKVVFQFGTNQGSGFVTGNLVPPSGGTPVPEPSSLLLSSIALTGIGCRYLRRRFTP